MCTGNEIKSTPGDATNCSADAQCNGITSVPNTDHSASGESKSLRILQELQPLRIMEERIVKIRCYWSLNCEITLVLDVRKSTSKDLINLIQVDSSSKNYLNTEILNEVQSKLLTKILKN